MRNQGLIVLAIAALIALMLPTAPAQFAPTSASAPAPVGVAFHATAGPAPALATPAAPAPFVGFPRTVLIETFTGEWCIHCPAESQALHYIDDGTSHNVLNIAELHVCAFASGSGPCLEPYVPSDGTSVNRETFYNVPGYPDVFFDGNYPIDGATNSASQMQLWYEDGIANASAYPGNVSISQSAHITPSSVVDSTNITSAITGSYNVITYLVQYINKLNQSNGYGPHDIDNVVRVSMMNHPVSLTSGATTHVSSSTPMNSSWNPLNLSVITFVQQNSTHIVENANMAPVLTVAASVSENVTAAISGTVSTVTVTVTNGSSGSPLAGAAVALTVQGGGSLMPSSGVTSASGTFTASYTAPTVTTATEVNITANITAANYTGGAITIPLIVNPWVLPLVPTGLTVTTGNSQVPLNWSAPSSGGVGLTYYVYRATASTGPFSLIATSPTASFADTSVTAGQSYWYKVAAKNAGGFSPNTTAIAATALTATPQGLPSTVGWWLAFGTYNFSDLGPGAFTLYLPTGTIGYTYGPRSYAYLAGTGSGTLSPRGVSLTVTATFAPRYANLAGTVSPASAVVVVNGSTLVVAGGAYSDLLVAGVYTVNVTATGYQSQQLSVTLTPGNLTTKNIALVALNSGGGGGGSSSNSGSGGLSSTQVLIVLAGVAGAAVILVLAAAMSRGRRGGQRPRQRAPPDNGMEP